MGEVAAVKEVLGKCMSPWIQALGTLLVFFFFCFTFSPFHVCVYSPFILEKLQPACGDCLSPLGVLVIGFVPTDQPITMTPAFSLMRPTRVSSSALHESPRHHVCDHALGVVGLHI